MLVCICVEFAVICCCVTVFGCVSMSMYGVVDVVECGLFLESRCAWLDCHFV